MLEKIQQPPSYGKVYINWEKTKGYEYNIILERKSNTTSRLIFSS